MKVFESFEIGYYNTTDQNAEFQWFSALKDEMKEMTMMIETRPRYPSDKLTFTIANLTRTLRTIHLYVDININMDSSTFDVDLFLEDSKRNFLNSFFLSI